MKIEPNERLEQIILVAIQESPIPSTESGNKRLAQRINKKIAEEANGEDSIYLDLYIDYHIDYYRAHRP